MKKLFTGCLALVWGFSHAQAPAQDSTKVLDHYVCVQANQLLRQIINLNNSSTVVSNPYLLTYGLFLSKCQWGVEGGVGYNYQRVKDKLSVTGQESKINDLFYRFGISKKIGIGRRWQA